MYIHMYMCVCVDSLAAQVFFKMIPSGSFPHLPKKRESLEKINLIIDVGNLGQNLSTSMQKKGRTTLEKEATFIGKTSY